MKGRGSAGSWGEAMFDGGEPAGTNGAKAEAEPAVIAEQIDPIVDAIVSGAVPNSLSSALYLGIV